MARLLTALFFTLALVRGFFDWQAATESGSDFTFQPIGQVWFDFHRASLLSLQPAVERYLSPAIWENLFRPITFSPMAPALLGIAIFFGLFSWFLHRKNAT